MSEKDYFFTPYLNFFFSSFFSFRSEFKSSFKKRLKELNIRQYYTKTSIWPKNSLCERVILTCKILYFRILYEFKTITYESALKLTQLKYNSRKHSSLFGYSPNQTHFDSHISSIVIRRTLESFRVRRKKIRSFFSLHPDNIFHVGERVLLARSRHKFHRANILLHSDYETEVREITKIDKTFLPWTYHISGEKYNGRKFYFFELKRVSASYGHLTPKPSVISPDQKIRVLDFQYENPAFLRSGKSINAKKTLYYTIKRGEKIERVPMQSLEFFKKILGNNILEYDENVFNKRENQHLKV